MINVDNLSHLKTLSSFEEVHKSEYFQKHFIERYICDIPRLALEVFGMGLTWQQVEVLENIDFIGGKLCVPSGHGTGKTRLIGVMNAAFLLLFKFGIGRIIAPSEKQVTDFSFKEVGTCIDGIKHKVKHNGKTYDSRWSFLHKFFVKTDTRIYIKGYKKEWNIHPATAPQGKPENISGFHNPYMLLTFDEASGIDDRLIANALGAASDTINSVVMFSQHTRNSGKFNDFVLNQNVDNGGSWKVVRLNSEQSPRISEKQLSDWRQTYDENEYNVKVLGLPPLFEEGYLLNSQQVHSCFSRKGKDWLERVNFRNVAISVDIAFTGLRDSSVIGTLNVAFEENANGKMKHYCVLTNVQKFHGKNKRLPVALMDDVMKTLVGEIGGHSEDTLFTIGVDANSGGTEAYEAIEAKVSNSDIANVTTTAIRWGSRKLVGTDKMRFTNLRAKGYILLKECVEDGRLFIETPKERTRILNELSKIPFKLDASFRYQMLQKKEMASMGISSPDIADVLAQAFLLDYIDGDNGYVEYDGDDGLIDASLVDEDDAVIEGESFTDYDDDEDEDDISSLLGSLIN